MNSTTPLPNIQIAVACGSELCDSEEGRIFLQKRQALFGKIGFLCSGGLYLFANLALVIGQAKPLHFPFTDVVNLIHLGCVATFLSIWLACRGRRRLRSTLYLVDTFGVFVVGILLGSLYASSGYVSHHDYHGISALSLTLFVRAYSVPSTARQTFITCFLASVPVVAGYAMFAVNHAETLDSAEHGHAELAPALAATVFGTWCLAITTVATVASRVSYGLQQEVRDARELGQYTLEGRIGKGGMGEVYRATHALLRRPTAVKIMRTDVAGEKAIARFEREVQLTSRLTHPNTIAIYDYGRSPDGTFYYAMEYLSGSNLEELGKGCGPQPAARVIHVLRQICASLAEAHDTGLIHRDIKPANIFLCERGGVQDVVKVLDFGLVKDVESKGDAQLSAANTITGSPMYLSPEAIKTPDKVDARSDLYAVGAIGYFLLTGTPVFESENVVEICGHHLHTTPQPPSERLGKAVPEDLERIIIDCLRKNPDERPADAATLRQRLGECNDAGTWTEADAVSWWQRWNAKHAEAESTDMSARSDLDPTQEATVQRTQTDDRSPSAVAPTLADEAIPGNRGEGEPIER